MRCHRVLFWSICTGLVLFAACSIMFPMLSGAPALRLASRHRDASETASRPKFNTESYAHQEDNPFLAVRDHPLSTFSIDVDTASYANVRRFVHYGRLPPKDAVRLEELVNYFRIEVKPPQDGSPLAAATEVGPCPWNPAHRLVRIGITGRGIEATAIPARNLVFLVDVSGSMYDPRKLPLVKRALALLVDHLREQDRVAIAVYAGNSGLVLPPTTGADKQRILAALASLQAGGSTNGGEGIRLAYRIAEEARIAGGVNRVILATDGDFNVGVTSEGDLVRLIEEKRRSGIQLSVLGFGMGNLKDSTMEKLADKGNGNYAYIDSLREARKVLVEEAGGTLVTVAGDVKVQVEFNPAQASSYRLLGYENRLLRDEQFDDDTADAGELGAGQTVTALYEVAPAGGAARPALPLRYQQERAPATVAANGELLTVKVRFKEPGAAESRLLSWAVRDGNVELAATTPDFRFVSAVAAWGMLLRESPHRGNADIALVRRLAESSLGDDPHGHRHEFLELVSETARLLPGTQPAQLAAQSQEKPLGHE